MGAGIAALVIPGAFAPGSAGAEDSRADRFGTAPSSGPIDPQVTPAAIDDSGRVTVMVEMEGAPVALREAARGSELGRTKERGVKSQLRAAQDRAARTIEARGGRVESYMQSAYNGMRVTVARNQLSRLTAIDGVKAVHQVPVYELDHETSVPFLGVPQVWEDSGFTGKNVKVAVIDTGIDYTHANFGGPGTVEAYETADATDTLPADPALFGPGAPRVKGGIDLVGDDYNPGQPGSVLAPDSNPLDCQGHGSHVAGTVGGSGVTPDGSTYDDGYDATTFDQDFKVGPGVAPQADLYAVRVFGCAGSTNVTTEAIDWAVANNMDVINMSLGSSYGTNDDPSSVASTNAVKAGVTVVTSAGNSGPAPYITGAPGAADGAVSVAATDPAEGFPGATLAFSDKTVQAINANGAELPAGPLTIEVLTDDPATGDNESLGCQLSDYAGITPGSIVITQRGACARVARAVYGQQAGAGAVVMINSTNAFPPFEGKITGNPDTGEDYDVTIPFLGVKGVVGGAPSDDGDALLAADGAELTLAESQIANPGFRAFASFSSGGPRSGDSGSKPNVSAPGVSILSTEVGTGSGGSVKSGTSMAAPHVAGVAALGLEAHPNRSAEAIASSLVSTADPAGVKGYRLTLGGTGLVDTAQVVGGDVVAYGDTASGVRTPSLSFGFDESATTFAGTKTVTLENDGDEEITYQVSTAATPQSQPASVSVSPSSVTVSAGESATVEVTLSANASQVAGSQGGSGGQHQFREISGNVVFSDGSGDLRVPYLLVPRSLSQVDVALDGPIDPRSADKQVEATVTNDGGAITGYADFYTWGVEDAADDAGATDEGVDLRALGAQSFDSQGDKLVVFAVNSHDRFSNAAQNEYDVLVDADNDGTDDFTVFAYDSGAIRAGSANGTSEVFLADLATGDLFATGFLASAPTDSGTVLLPVLAGDLGVTAESGPFRYAGAAFGRNGGLDTTSPGRYRPWKPALSSDGAFVPVAPGGSEKLTIDISTGGYRSTKALGLMAVVYDNAAGAAEAVTVRGR